MNKKIQEKIIDITGVELTPGMPAVCLGNGKHGFACCCDECDFFLRCFPEYDVEIQEENFEITDADFEMSHDTPQHKLSKKKQGA